MRERTAKSGTTNRPNVAGRTAMRRGKTLLTLCVVMSAGCGSAGFLGLQDYQRDLLFGIGSLAISLLNPAPQGPPGLPGEPGVTIVGESGTACWDTNGNNFGDPAEDTNGDNAFNVLDCQGADGAPGPTGSSGEPGEQGESGAPGLPGMTGPPGDAGSSGAQGSTGPAGSTGPTGPQGPAGRTGPQGAAGSNLFDTFIDDFVTVQGGSYDGIELDPGGGLPVVEIREPALGANCNVGGVGVLAYRVGISQRYTEGNPVTMRLYFWRTGPKSPSCFVFRLDAFRARHNSAISGYDAGDNTRYIRPLLPDLIEESGMLLVVDLPLNNTSAGNGLGFANDLKIADLLAFELSTHLQDGGCYALMAADFFESEGQGSELLANAAVFADADDINCEGQCVVNADCPDLDGLFCNGGQICVGGVCQPGPTPDCSDGVGCTIDSCNEATNSCDHVDTDANCNDGLFCNGVETCDPINGCQPGTPPNCNDGLFCNGVETCDPINGCQPGTPPNCNDGLFCNGVETCHPINGCQPGQNPCPYFCREEDDQCIACLVDDDCNDSEICTQDTCEDGVCVFTPLPPVTSCPDLEIVFIIDTSPSMNDEAEQLCEKIELIIAQIEASLVGNDPPVSVERTILGITEDGNINDGDDDGDPYDDPQDCPTECDPDFGCLLSDVLDELGGMVPGNNGACPGNLLDAGFNDVSETENWASASAIVAERFPWKLDPVTNEPSTVRLIIPISDEGPCMGGQDEAQACGVSDMNATSNAATVASANQVIVSPIIGTPFEGQPGCILTFAEQLADQTGGMWFQTTNPAEQLVDFVVEAALSACMTACSDRGPNRFAMQAAVDELILDGPIAVSNGVAGDEGPDE